MSGDAKRAMDTYIEALKVNPYLWEAFDGLVELGIIPNLTLLMLHRRVPSRRKLFQG